jgi:hypothetical protein
LLIRIDRRVIIIILCVEGIWWMIEDRVPIVIHTGNTWVSTAKFER